MVSADARVYLGPWRRLVNSAAAQAGSIHDDAAARASGFEGGFVPGSTVGTLALSAVSQRFGPRWLAGGWYSLTFVSPVYEHTDVRVLGEPVPESDELAVRVETPEGRICCSGRAGLGDRLPWNPTNDGARGAEHVLPDIPLGLALEPVDVTLGSAEVQSLVDAAGDDATLYRDGSTFGAPLVPPERWMVVALRMQPPRRLTYGGVRPPGMWARHDLVIRRPIFLATPYRARARVVDKGRSGRSIFLTYEFDLFHADGAEVARGRHSVKWFAAEEETR